LLLLFLFLPLFHMVFDHLSTSQCGDSLLMIRSTLIHHVVFIRISQRLTLKLSVLPIGVVVAFFEVSFYLGDGFCNVKNSFEEVAQPGIVVEANRWAIASLRKFLS
jgi:hypothetical protein